MKTQISGQAVAKALRQEPLFKECDPDLWREIEAAVYLMPDVLKDLLDEPAIISNILKARILFLNHYLSQNYISKMLDHLPKIVKFLFQTAELRALLVQRARNEMNEATKVLDALDKGRKLERYYREYLLNPKRMGTTQELFDKIIRGDITIGQLLLLKPSVIVKI